MCFNNLVFELKAVQITLQKYFVEPNQLLANLTEKVKQYDLTVENVPSDGNCLFEALALQVKDKTARKIRNELTNYVSTHPEVVSSL